jgi:uncharacterized metal-binding protein YceD (DUF177 family)
MDSLKHFVIPISGLYQGVHEYHFEVDDDFFKFFENAPIQHAKLILHLSLLKQPSFIALDFKLSGRMGAACDRCMASINLPIQNKYSVILKYGSEDSSEEEEDVIYINEDIETFDLSRIAYEVICLSIPISKTYDCDLEDPIPCDEEVLRRLELKVEEEKESGNTALGDALKNLKLK